MSKRINRRGKKNDIEEYHNGLCVCVWCAAVCVVGIIYAKCDSFLREAENIDETCLLSSMNNNRL